MRTINKKLKLNTTPDKIYHALLDSQLHTQITGSTAKVSDKQGDTFLTFDGWANGENLELVKNKKIVQSWRVQDEGWPEEHFSKITFELTETPEGTELSFNHTEIPEEAVGDYEQGWEDYYWIPLQEMFNS